MFTWHERFKNEQLKQLLESLHVNRTRIRIWYGNTETGKVWLEEHDVKGTIGRSTGEKKIPLLIPKYSSLGGVAILYGCIVRIDNIVDKRTIYQHKDFYLPKFEIIPSDLKDYSHAVLADNELVALFKTQQKAERYVQFMKGERYSK